MRINKSHITAFDNCFSNRKGQMLNRSPFYLTLCLSAPLFSFHSVLYLFFLIFLYLVFLFLSIEFNFYEATGWQSCRQKQRLKRPLLHGSFSVRLLSSQFVFHDLVMTIAHFSGQSLRLQQEREEMDEKFWVACCVKRRLKHPLNEFLYYVCMCVSPSFFLLVGFRFYGL